MHKRSLERFDFDSVLMPYNWYQPLEDQGDIDCAVHRVIGRPHIFLNTAGDMHLLPKVLDAACRFDARPSVDDMTAMLDQQHMTSLFGI
ncbi:hypothetical protein NKDENANG_01656 [Candidatus Entotheonellaceae bacterium PAL068K]